VFQEQVAVAVMGEQERLVAQVAVAQVGVSHPALGKQAEQLTQVRAVVVWAATAAQA